MADDQRFRVDTLSENAEGGVPARTEKQVYLCDLCGVPMLNLHCKLICEQCGYKRDCSDP
ncbi:MAG TPA: hypothetical protein DG084_03260 [Gemmatimonadetes bacterium]|nr:hypothetical protein [Gemmatimonadota bacterium]